MSIGASTRWVLARRLVIVAWLLVTSGRPGRGREGGPARCLAVSVVSAVRPLGRADRRRTS
jgi:hypothetical protein